MFARHISDDKRDNIRKNTIIDSELQVKMMYEFFGKVQIPLSELCQLETLIPLINPGDKIFKYATAFNTCGKIISDSIQNIKLYYELKSDYYEDDGSMIKIREYTSEIWKEFINNYTINSLHKTTSPIECEVEIDKSVPQEFVIINDILFKTLINNLIHNSFIYTNSGFLRLYIYSTGSVINIEIEDSGPGMQCDHLDDVFDPFSKFNNDGVGPGIGLSVSKEICKYMDGDIEIIKSDKNGTKIKAFFEYKSNALKCTFPSTNFNMNNLKTKKGYLNDIKQLTRSFSKDKKKILIVEDSKITRLLICSFLRNDQYTVEQALSGKEAVEMCKNQRYDIILMDVNMPIMNGFTAINIIKEECELNFSTPVVMMSGTNIDDIGFLHHTNSPIHFLTKPVRQHILIRVLSKLT